MLCSLVDYVTEHGGDVADKPVNPSEPTDPSDEPKPSDELGQKLPSGATAAAGVLSSIGKDDAYPTYGNSEIVSNNGYFTGATSVDIGNARLVYELLDMVNEVRVAEGHEPLTWIQTDSAEEHTLQRCWELVTNYSHERPEGKFAGEDIAYGQRTAAQGFNEWMESPAHKDTLMSDTIEYISAAQANGNGKNYWIICVWDEWGIKDADKWAENNYDMSSVIDG